MPYRASRYLVIALSSICLLTYSSSSAEACWWGWGWWGGGYGSYYSPTPVTYGYAGYSSYGSACGYGGCSTGACGSGGCGVTSYYAGSSCGSCGTCGPCGLSSCGYGCGTACGYGCSGNCATGDCSVNFAPAGDEPVPDENISGNGTDEPRTYSEEPEEDRLPPRPADDDFEEPIRGREDSSIPGSGSSIPGGGSSIPGGGSSIPEGGSSIPRGGLSIPMDSGAADPFPERSPAGAEPGAGESINFEPRVEPLELNGPLTLNVSPTRTRVSVKARYRLPSVARVKVVPDNDGWIPVADDATPEPAKVASN